MKFLEAFETQKTRPKLIPNFKQTERRLLSVFLALLSISATVRSRFLKSCGYNSGLTCKYNAAMEVTFKGSQMPEVRPDGLIHCQKGQTNWSAFVEAKSEGNLIRSDQITSYLELAKLTGCDNVITISNEYARVPSEPPYHVDPKKSRSIGVHHFAWAEIRTTLELLRADVDLPEVERAVLEECLEYFWDEKSGIQTYNLMPEVWPAFVEASSTALGFNTNIRGLADVVYGWQQERRDLSSKLTRLWGRPVELRHKAGVRSSDEERSKVDRQDLASDYTMSAHYYFKDARSGLEVLLDLRACRMSAALDIPVPDGKGAKACVTWLERTLSDTPSTDSSVCFDWPGRGGDIHMSTEKFSEEPEIAYQGQKNPPKSMKLVVSRHGVRDFKSRKKIILNVEQMVLDLAGYGIQVGWL